METLTPEKCETFKSLVWSYYRQNGRFFAWRHTENPYYVVVSEVMLQQTQTYRVEPFFERFISLFPDFSALASAPWSEVVGCWQGLGYNRRAKYLHQLAQAVVARHNGILPQDIAILDSFPGIGYATACSIYTFAFNCPSVFIETNVRAVFLHHFFNTQDSINDSQLLPLIEQTVDHEYPRDWYYALMDYGVMIKKVYGNPNRRSKGYAKQSKFDGSDRQIRGAIIRLLTANSSMTYVDIKTMVPPCHKDRFDNIIDGLVRENLIHTDDNVFWL